MRTHLLIKASAGTGKTFQLTTRYLRLLMDGVPPEKILALTFTRKAAGEFFEKIFARLARAAAGAEGAAELSAQLEIAASQTRYLETLRLLLRRLHLLRLSTYDSFFGRIIRSFPLELGLDGPPRVLDGWEREAAVRESSRLLVESGTADSRLSDFWHAYKQATFGREGKSVNSIVFKIVEELHALYLEAPEEERWSGEAIWPGRNWAAAHFDFARAADVLRRALPLGALTPTRRQKTALALEQLAAWRPPQRIDAPLRNLLRDLVEAHEQLPTGTATTGFWGKKFAIPGEAGRLCHDIVAAAWDAEIRHRREAMLGRHGLLRLFEAIYDRETRRKGLLTYADMTRLLADRSLSPLQARASEIERQLVDYRLDCRHDHWLLDEFQDTSYGQWRAIQALADEVIQSDPRERSFFAVGDTKQCIYMWREGDDRLFDQLLRRYGKTIRTGVLRTSQRSCPAVLGMVNATFGTPGLIGGVLSKSLARRWSAGWEEHRPDPRLESLTGHAALLYAPDDEEETRFQLALELLVAIEPAARELSAAILVRRNDEAIALHEYFKRMNGPETALGSDITPGNDNPLGALIESLVILAAHPGDRLALRHVSLTPGAALTRDLGAFVAETNRSILELGFERTLRSWIDRLPREAGAMDEFTRLRAAQILAAAREFDQTGDSDPERFIEHLRRHAIRAAGGARNVIPILTVHKAKGLDWDLVILPCLNRNTLFARNDGGVPVDVHRSGDRTVNWVFDLPGRDWLAMEPPLLEFDDERREDGAYESLCALYVAMTRAKRGLYLITTPSGVSSSLNYYKLLDAALASMPPHAVSIGGKSFTAAWQKGESGWFEAASLKREPPREPRFAVLAESERRPGGRIQRVRPSAAAPRTVSGSSLFKLGGRRGIELGAEVHLLFERIDWLSGDPARDAPLVRSLGADVSDEALREVLRCAESPELRSLFATPEGPALLWKEKPIEFLHEGTLMSGQIDRAVVRLDSEGKPLSAEIVDFKTDAIGAAEDIERAACLHAAQIQAYRRALAATLGLALDQVTGTLVFTNAPVRRAVR